MRWSMHSCRKTTGRDPGGGAGELVWFSYIMHRVFQLEEGSTPIMKSFSDITNIMLMHR